MSCNPIKNTKNESHGNRSYKKAIGVSSFRLLRQWLNRFHGIFAFLQRPPDHPFGGKIGLQIQKISFFSTAC
jgi:hypothetical protein